MKKIRFLSLAAVLVLALLMLTGCGKSTFAVTENTEKRMVITAENAEKDAFFMVGSLEIEDGEQVAIQADLSRGSVHVELIIQADEQSIDTLPEVEGNQVRLTAQILKGTDMVGGTLPAGSYLVRATCLEKTTGTVLVEVKPAA